MTIVADHLLELKGSAVSRVTRENNWRPKDEILSGSLLENRIAGVPIISNLQLLRQSPRARRNTPSLGNSGIA